MKRKKIIRGGLIMLLGLIGVISPAAADTSSSSQRHSSSSHSTPGVATVNVNVNTSEVRTFSKRKDIKPLPTPLRQRLLTLAGRPHTYLPLQVFAEADSPSQLFAYSLLDSTGFEPNVFTSVIPGVNDHTAPTATGANGNLPTVGAIRMVVEPKPGLPTDPNDPGAFIDMFTDISGLFVINNESGWYEGWLIHDVVVPPVDVPRADGHAQFGKMTQQDADAVSAIGAHNNVPGNLFTVDGLAPHAPSATDVFPTSQTNLVSVFLSLGAYNSLQQSDAHSYWELNQYTNWVHPLYELPFTGGQPGSFEAGLIGAIQSIIPGSGPAGIVNTAVAMGDNPFLPRDPDRALNASPTDPDRPTTNDDTQKETRLRFIPSGLANEIMLDVYVRLSSFEPAVVSTNQRLFDAYAAEVARIDGANGGAVDGVVTFVEADLESTSDGGQSNDRLYIPAPQYNRVAVTREIDDGLLAPRFAPSQKAWVQSGNLTLVNPVIAASTGRDGDDR